MCSYGPGPFLECSSEGDRRFSAHEVRLQVYGNSTIDEIAHAVRIYQDGSSRKSYEECCYAEALGLEVVNQRQCDTIVERLWTQYFNEHLELHGILKAVGGVSDRVVRPAKTNHVRGIWAARCKLLGVDPEWERWEETNELEFHRPSMRF